MATENVGPARHCRLGPASVAEAIERPRRILIASTETRPDGSSFDTTLEFTFEPRGGSAGSTAELAASPLRATELRSRANRLRGRVYNRAMGSIRMNLSFGQRISGVAANGAELHAPVFDENQVRAAAGLTMVMGTVAFGYAYFDANYLLLQIVSTVFFVEFLVRVTAGIHYSPVGIVARLMTLSRERDWVSAKPKRFAWTLGLGLSFAMMIITNSGVRGTLPRTICLVCLTLMWMESVLGVCVGCKLHALLVRRGWTTKDPAFEVCAHGECALPAPAPAPASVARVEA